MKTILQKILLLVSVMMIGGSAWADTVTFTPSDFSGQGTFGSGSAMSATKDGVTLACDYGYGTTDIRCYNGSTVTISSSKTITALSFSFADDNTGELNASYTGLSTTSWSKRLYASAHISSVIVTYTATASGPTHKATFYVNGSIYNETEVGEGAAIGFPANPSALGGKSFVGWVSSPIVGTTDDAPAMVTSVNMGDADRAFYAVYATLIPGDQVSTIDNMTPATIAVYSYADWSGKTWNSDAIYAGNSGIQYDCIQLRPSDNSGIVSTKSGGRVGKVAIEWLSTTPSGRTLQIYGKNSKYDSAADLYSDSKKGTLLGTIVMGTNTELTIDGNYTYVGLRSSNYALFLSTISITWINGNTPDTYTAYCTTITITTPAVTEAGWGTYVTPYDMEFADNEAYVVTAVGDNVTLQSVTKVRAGVPVVLKGAGSKTAAALNEAPAVVDNKLAVSTGGAVDGYVLSNKNSKVGFYKWTGGSLAEGKVYLPTSAVSSAREFVGFDETMGISAVNSKEAKGNKSYNLAGQRIVQPSKGLYIVNGKKVVIAK